MYVYEPPENEPLVTFLKRQILYVLKGLGFLILSAFIFQIWATWTRFFFEVIL